jgi:molybdate transport system substrate-binding protein
MRVMIVAAICAAAFTGQAAAADIKVFSDGPLERALVAAAKAFGNETGQNVNFVFGLSPVIHKRISEGERGDLVIIQPNFMDELVKAGKVVAGDHPMVGHVGIGLMVRADAKAPDVASVEAFKRALQAADAIVFNNVASGNAFAQILDRIGLTDVITRILQGTGDDIGVSVMPLIIADKRLKLAGTLPTELQSPIPYAVAPMTDAGQPEAAKAFVQFLVSPKAKAEFAAAGVN